MLSLTDALTKRRAVVLGEPMAVSAGAITDSAVFPITAIIGKALPASARMRSPASSGRRMAPIRAPYSLALATRLVARDPPPLAG